MSHTHLATAHRYLAALEQGVDEAALAAFFAPDVVQIEYPNRLVVNGATRDLAALLAGHTRGKQIMSAQRFAVQNAVAAGDHVALEVLWTGVLAVPLGTLAAGAEMRAYFAVFLTFKDDKITAQRNYDCFEPW